MRRALVQTHLWLGLTLGVFWALQGLTGAALVFHRDLTRLAISQPMGGALAPMSDILKSAARISEGARITRLSISDPHRDVIDVSYVDRHGDTRAMLLDAASAQQMGERDTTLWLLDFHMSLLSGRAGEVFIGISGIVLLTAALIGLRLAWPPRKGWKTAYSFRRWRTKMQRLYGWHRAIGLTVATLASIVALSGVWMTFEDSLRPALARVISHQLPYRPTAVAALGETISADRALSIAQARLPNAQWVRITLPTAKAPVYAVRFHQREASIAWLGRTSVVVDASTGRVDSVYDPTNAPLSNRIVDAVLPFHDGEQFGLVGRVTMMLVALSLPTLYVTALWRWLAQRRRRVPLSGA